MKTLIANRLRLFALWLHGTSFSTMLSWIFDNEVFAPMPKSKEDNLYQAW